MQTADAIGLGEERLGGAAGLDDVLMGGPEAMRAETFWATGDQPSKYTCLRSWQFHPPLAALPLQNIFFE